MNYGSQQSVDGSYQSIPAPESLLSSLVSQFHKVNAEYCDILYSLEDKMHGILNLRSVDSKSGEIANSKEKSINDFAGSLGEMIQTYRNQNGRLQKVLDHLKQVIG